MSQLCHSAAFLQSNHVYPVFKLLSGLHTDDIAALVLIAILSLSYRWTKPAPANRLFFESLQDGSVTARKDANARNIVEKMRELVCIRFQTAMLETNAY
jgi:hypothetical protein